MTDRWLETLADWLESESTVVLVTVAHVEGSAPREAGTSFLVSATRCEGTIGGGHLEFEAIREARQMHAAETPSMMKRYALGPSLGQCCGGVVWLLFERILAAEKKPWQERARRVRQGEALARQTTHAHHQSSWTLQANAAASVDFELKGADWRFTQTLLHEPFSIFVFGAGHVGEAIVRALAPLSREIVWIDSREDVFPADLPAHVEARWTDAPDEEVATAPPHSYFLVLTHSHDLDLKLCERILARNDFAFFGLIGSKSKRARFDHRLRGRGLDTARMTCPIGIPGIAGKSPAIIAVAVAAQLVQIRESLPTPAKDAAVELS